MHVDIVVPAYNEEGNLERTISKTVTTLRADLPDDQFTVLIVASVGSDDDTLAIASDLEERYPKVDVLVRTENPGFGNAIKDGIDATDGDVVIPFMADLSDDPADISKLVAAIRGGSDVAYGSRFIPGGEVNGYPRLKLLYNRLFNNTIRLLFGVQAKDITNAFTAYRREVVDEIGMDQIDSEGFDITAELPLRAHIRGFVSEEVPVSWNGRQAGVSKLNATRAGPVYGKRLLDLFVHGNVLALRDLFGSVAGQGARRILGATVFGVLLLVALFTLSGFQEVFSLVLRSSPTWIAAAAGSYALSFAFRTWRWRVLLRTAGNLASRGGAFRCIMFGWFINFLIPARVGDFARALSLKTTEEVPFSVGGATIVLERALDLLVLAGGMTIIVLTVMPHERTMLLAVGALAIAGVLLAGLLVLQYLPDWVVVRIERRIPHIDVRQGIATLRSALRRTADNPFGLLLAALLSVPVWVLEIGTIYFSARAVGVQVGIWAVSAAGITAFVTQSVPVSPAGIGTYEASITLVLGLFGVASEQGTAVALVDHFMRIGLVYVVGAIAAVHIGFRSRAYFRDRDRGELSEPETP